LKHEPGMRGTGGAGGVKGGALYGSSDWAIDVIECPSKNVDLENIVSTLDVIDNPASEVPRLVTRR